MLNFFRKIASYLLICSMTAVLLTGCGLNGVNEVQSLGKTDGEKIKLTFFGNKADESNVHVIENIISSFVKTHPNITISYESIKGNDYFDVLNKRMASDSGDDIFMVNHDTMLELHQKGQVVDLSDLSTIKSYTELQKSQFTDENGVFWLPTTVSAFGLYCNMDLLKEHGQSVPTNLSEFRAVCDYFVKKGITPIIANNDISLKTIMIGASYYDEYQAGTTAQLFAGLNDGSAAIGSSMQSGIELVNEIISKGYVDAAASLQTKKTSDDLKNFAQGKNPFMLTGVWAANRLKTDFAVKFQYEVHPLPVLPDGSMVVVNPDIRLCVNAGSEHVKEAKEFIEYFTQAENLYALCEDQCSINPIKGGKSSSAKEIQSVVACYAAGRAVIGTDAKLDLPVWGMTKDASKALLQGKDVNTVIKAMNKSAKEYLGK